MNLKGSNEKHDYLSSKAAVVFLIMTEMTFMLKVESLSRRQESD